MKISQAFNFAKLELLKCGIENPFLEATILLTHLTSFSKEQIIFDENLELSESQFESLKHLIVRRCRKEPISHIINNREFFGLDFFVDKNVLDPRPDSEHLVELALKKIDEMFLGGEIKMLEIGVGSGCLTISILKNAKNCQALGFDISQYALEICAKNIKTHELKNRFEIRESNLFSAASKNEKFDVIISNPPYIKSQEIEDLQDEVRIFEPRGALDGGLDGLDFYREIAINAPLFLKENSILILEIGFDQKDEVCEIFEENGFYLDCHKQDLAGRDRVLGFRISK